MNKLCEFVQHLLRRQWKSLLLVGLAAVCLSLFTAIAEDVVNKEEIVRVDVVIADMLHNNATPAVITVFGWITLLGNEGLYLLTGLVIIYCLLKRQWWGLLAWVTIIGLGGVLNSLLKNAFVRPRPIFLNPIMIEHGYSFPSGHAMGSLIAYGLLAYFMCIGLPRWHSRLGVILTAALLILLIGLSRIVLGVHYLSDVLGGFAAGGLWLTLSILCMNIIATYRSQWHGSPVSQRGNIDTGAAH